MALPRGYTKLEYIESTGTQYIDTGFKPNQDTRVNFVFLPVSTNNTHFFGSRTSSSASDKFLTIHAEDTDSIRDDYGSEATATSITPPDLTVIDKNKNVTNINGTVVSHAVATFSGLSMFLFACNTGGTPSGKTSIRLVSCQIYDNGTLVRDFLPCANPSGAVGLWDDVNGVFYGNTGTGTFVAGPAAVQGGTPIKNLVPTDGWSLSGVTYENGVFTFDPGVTAIATVAMPTPSAGHKYYGRAMQMAPDGLTFADHRFEWYVGDAENSLMVFATLEGTGDQWRIDSAVMSLNVPADGSWTIRNFIVNGSATTYRKELLIVDLTEAFGEGNEPDKAWCDSNIPHFTGTLYLAEQPEGLTVLGSTRNAVILGWAAVPTEHPCRLYRDGVLIYEGSDISCTDHSLSPGQTYSYRITGYNGQHETAGEVLSAATTSGIVLITDRTAADVAAGRPKGFYNALDLIRVGEAMVYAQGLLKDSGYAVSIAVKLDWQLNDIPTKLQMDQYISSVRNLQHAMDLLATTPAAPDSMSGLGYAGANDIETILEDIEYTVQHVFSGMFRSGQFDVWAGDRRPIPTANSDLGRTWETLDAMETTWANWEVASWYLLLYGNLKEEGVVS